MRVNIVPPVELMDQHLMAEIREIKMLPKCLVRSLKSKNGVDWATLPQVYTMGPGHGKFFYDKMIFIVNRFRSLLDEASARGFQLKEGTMQLLDATYDYGLIGALPPECKNTYEPTPEALAINRERIAQRIAEKPDFYRYKGVRNDI